MPLGAFERARGEQGLVLDPDDLTYFLGRETIIVTWRKGMATWREKLFGLMALKWLPATAFFRLPPERVVELSVRWRCDAWPFLSCGACPTRAPVAATRGNPASGDRLRQ